MGSHSKKKHPDTEMLARRKLLKMSVYVPPAILGAMTVQPTTSEAATITCGGVPYTVSACGVACCPCATNPNSNNCKDAQCQAGCCFSCANKITASYATQAECDAAAASFGACMVCTCTQKVTGPKKKPTITWDLNCN